MKSLVKKISQKLREFGLENINGDTVVTVELETKEVNVFNTNEAAFKGKETFRAYNFIYNVSDDILDVNNDEIKA
jgi:ribonuclease HIII